MAAPNGAVAATAIFTGLGDRAQDGLRAELAERGAPLLRRRPVDGEDAVQMIELDDDRGGAQREASLVGDLELLALGGEAWIDEPNGRRVLSRPEHELPE